MRRLVMRVAWLSLLPRSLWALDAAKPVETAVQEARADSFYDPSSNGASVTESPEAPLLSLYGFVDLTYTKNLDGADSPYDKFPQFGSFAVGNVNLYAASNLGSGWRSLIEVRFLYLPHGSDKEFSTNGSVGRVDDSTNDYTDFGRKLRWGGIELERAFLEYEAAPWLTVQAGQYLTPYGIWNIDHGSPTIVPVRRPFVIGEGVFPERQTGLEVHGAVDSGHTSFGYHLTASNGRGPLDSYLDLDNNTAIGGRLFVKNTSVGMLTVGASGYSGTYTDRTKAYGPKPSVSPAQIEIKDAISVQLKELALGGDVRWEWDDLLVQGEAIAGQRVYVDPYRAVEDSTAVADSVRLGGYALVGYRTPWLSIMPYTMAEYYNFAGSALFPPAVSTSTGLNVRPQANVVLKLQYQYSQMGTVSSPELIRGTLHQVDAQAAWAF